LTKMRNCQASAFLWALSVEDRGDAAVAVLIICGRRLVGRQPSGHCVAKLTYCTMCREYIDYLICKDLATISSPDGKTLDSGVLGGKY
jgi:hypothetical protein